MTPEQIQAVKETGMCCEQALVWDYYETDEVGYAKAVCKGCFTKFIRKTEVVNLDAVE